MDEIKYSSIIEMLNKSYHLGGFIYYKLNHKTVNFYSLVGTPPTEASEGVEDRQTHGLSTIHAAKHVVRCVRTIKITCNSLTLYCTTQVKCLCKVLNSIFIANYCRRSYKMVPQFNFCRLTNFV